MSGLFKQRRTAGAAAWADVFARHRSWLSTIVRSRLPDPHEAADVLQEIALGLLGRDDDPGMIERLEPWLYRVAVRQVLMFRRRRGRERQREQRWSAERVSPDEPAPVDWVVREEARDRVRQAMAELRSTDRDVLLLKYVERWSYERIGNHLGLSRHAVEYRLLRARDELRRRLGATYATAIAEC